MKNDNEVIIVGAGMVGLSLAALLVKAGIRVAIVESQSPSFESKIHAARVSAINVASESLFKSLGIWDLIEPLVTSLEKMKVWDSISGQHLEFDSAEAGVIRLGSIVSNQALVKILWQYLESQQGVNFVCPAEGETIEMHKDYVQLNLKDGSALKSALLVGADGGHSWVRESMRIKLNQYSYLQSAIVATIESEKPHNNTAYQNFLPAGPLGILPLNETHQSSIVWSNDTEKSEALMKLSDVEFNRELTNASEFCLGKLKLLSVRHSLPLWMRHAKQYLQSRVVLVGDSAHTIHPLAGQGVNLGLMDAMLLSQKIIEAKAAGKDLNNFKLLRQYERERKAENEVMIRLMSAFKGSFSIEAPLWVQLRGIGIGSINRFQALKNYMMRFAMGN